MAIRYTTDEFFWRDARVIAGDSFVSFYSGTVQTFGGASWQFSGAVGDALEFDVTLDPGNYNMRIESLNDSFGGITDISIDGVVVSTIDMYDPGFVDDVFYDIPVTITQLHSIFLSEVVGQNGASFGAYVYASRVIFTPL